MQPGTAGLHSGHSGQIRKSTSRFGGRFQPNPSPSGHTIPERTVNLRGPSSGRARHADDRPFTDQRPPHRLRTIRTMLAHSVWLTFLRTKSGIGTARRQHEAKENLFLQIFKPSHDVRNPRPTTHPRPTGYDTPPHKTDHTAYTYERSAPTTSPADSLPAERVVRSDRTNVRRPPDGSGAGERGILRPSIELSATPHIPGSYRLRRHFPRYCDVSTWVRHPYKVRVLRTRSGNRTTYGEHLSANTLAGIRSKGPGCGIAKNRQTPRKEAAADSS